MLFRDDMPGSTVTDGERILAHGRVTVYPQRGELQFVCDFFRPEGVGLQAARFEQLHARLEAEGLFEPSRKRALPAYPRRIGLVTSPTGAALQDVRNVLAQRWPITELVLSPALVQGEQAAASVVDALRTLAEDPALDLAIVARGGGGSEDLSAFNDEAVVRTIFGFPIPVVTGIGHETATSLADLAADVRAPTPSVAAPARHPRRDRSRRPDQSSRFRHGRSRARRDRCAHGAAPGGGCTCPARPPPVPGARLSVWPSSAPVFKRRWRRAWRQSARPSNARTHSSPPSIPPPRSRAATPSSSAWGRRRRVVRRVKDVKGGNRVAVAVGDGAFWAEVS